MVLFPRKKTILGKRLEHHTKICSPKQSHLPDIWIIILVVFLHILMNWPPIQYISPKNFKKIETKVAYFIYFVGAKFSRNFIFHRRLSKTDAYTQPI